MSKPGPKSGLDPVLVAADVAAFNGNFAAVARKHKVDRSTISKFVDRNPILKKAAHDVREGMLDNAESALYTAVIRGDAWAVCFFLKCQGKSRGYVEKVEVETQRQPAKRTYRKEAKK